MTKSVINSYVAWFSFLSIFSSLAIAEPLCDLKIEISNLREMDKEGVYRLDMRIVNATKNFEAVELPATFYTPYYNLLVAFVDNKGSLMEYVGPELKLGSSGKRLWLYPGYYFGREIDIKLSWWRLSKGKYKMMIRYLPWNELGKKSTCSLVSNEIELNLINGNMTK